MNPKIHQRNGRYNFTPSEIAEIKDGIPVRISSTIGPKQREINKLKADIKTLQTAIDQAVNENEADSRKLQDGYENRNQPCYRLKNFKRRVFQYFTIDDMRMINEVPFEDGDDQMDAFGDDLREVTEGYTGRELYHEGKTYAFPSTLDWSIERIK